MPKKAIVKPAKPTSETRPEDKLLSDKLLEELKSSEKNVDESVPIPDVSAHIIEHPVPPIVPKDSEAPDQTESNIDQPSPQPAQATKDAIPVTEAPPATPEPQTTAVPPEPVVPVTPAPVSPVVPVTPPETAPPKKGFHFPRIPFKIPTRKQQPPPETVVPETTQVLTSEVLLKMIDEKTKKLSGDDFLIIRISKQGFLITTGLILILIWVFPLLEMSSQKIKKRVTAPTGTETEAISSSESPSASPLPLTESPIRVRLQNNSLDAANEIKQLFTKAGFTQIDIVYDQQVNANTVLIASRTEDAALKELLASIFSDTYNVASENAVLTEDSSFAATVLIGKNSLKMKK